MHRQKTRFLHRLLSRLLLGLFCLATFVPQVKADYSEGELFYNQHYEVHSNEYRSTLSTPKENSSGAFTYSYPIITPPGRLGLEPQLSLNYNNQSKNLDNFFGYGWSLDLPSIYRTSKHGVDALYSGSLFMSSMSGELVPVTLVDEIHGEYAAQVENGEFLIYEFNEDGYWTLTNKSGAVYTFGSNAFTQQEDPNSTSNVYKWMLEEIRDTNDNFISYEYTEDEGQIYPSRINYTGHGSTEGLFSIEFGLTGTRTDQSISFTSGFAVKTYDRISSISIYEGENWVKQYELTYGTGSNGYLSLLSSITETARSDDGTEVSRPPIQFEYQSAEKTWTSSSYFQNIPTNFFTEGNTSSGTYDTGGRDVDLNGDGLPDFFSSWNTDDDATPTVTVYENGGLYDATEELESYTIPVALTNLTRNEDKGVRFGEMNGDGLIDFVKNYNGAQHDDGISDGIYLNQGDGTWSLDSAYSLPQYAFVAEVSATGEVRDTGTRLMDLNGDGLSDIVSALEVTDRVAAIEAYVDYDVFLNKGDGSGFEEQTDFEIPVGFITYDPSQGGADRGVRMGDINGDGLLDFVKAYGGENSSDDCAVYHYCIANGIYINQGNGTWTEGSSLGFTSNIDFSFTSLDANSVPVDQGTRMTDLNGDGMDDILIANNSGGSIQSSSYLNGGTGGVTWSSESEYTFPASFTQDEYRGEMGTRLSDLNGDGLVDFIRKGPSSGESNSAYIQDGEVPDLLSSITLSNGGSISVTYQGSAEYAYREDEVSDYQSYNPDLPFTVQTVSEIRVDDGFGGETVNSYVYEGGQFYYEDEENKQFAGFSSITKTEEGRSTMTAYHQDDLAKIGKPHQTDVYDDSGNLYLRTIESWETSDLGYGNDFVYKSQSVSMNYDGGSGHRDSATAYTYDSYGNILTQVNYGEVTAGEDGSFTDVINPHEKFTIVYTYATDGNGLIRNKVSQETVRDAGNTVISRKRYYYDGLTLNSVSTGNLSSDRVWLDSNNTWFGNTYTVNSYGLMERITNARNFSTTISYDSTYLYPSVTTNALGYTVSTVYDPALGALTSQTNENAFTTVYSYDGLGRVLTVSVPDPDTGVSALLSSTTYDDSSFPTSSLTTSTVNGVSSTSATYFDGLGRSAQTKISAKDGVYTTADVWYDELENVSQQTLPYESTSLSWTDRDLTAYSINTAYDALNRPLSITDPNGTTTYSYSPWENTLTNANGINKVYSYGSAGQLLTVEEHNDPGTGIETYTTAYDYDELGRLLTLTDAESKLRNFTYDSLGRKISQEDLHDASETTFGMWTYSYDKNGNLSSQTDPKGQIITWGYDALDRPTYEDWNSATPSRDITYTYDRATNGKMQLYKVTMSGYTLTYGSYNALGNLTRETRRIGSTNYVLQYDYDLLGRQTQVIYPGNALTVNSSYNEAGLLESVSKGAPFPSDIISNIDYSPLSQLSTITYGNGVTTTNTFDPAEAYRLTRKITTGIYSETLDPSVSSSNVQDLTYSYDSLGNITGIVDTSSTPTAKTITYTYDDLNRLLSATTSGLSSASNAGGDYTENYTYSPIGNLTYKSDVGDLLYEGTGASSGSYAGANPHAVTSVAGAAYTYDDNGNLTSNGSASYTWNIKNQLESSGNLTFSYDHTGSRYKTIDSSSGTDVSTYYLSPYEEIRDITATAIGTPTYFVFAGGQRVASYEDTDEDGTKEFYYYHQDHLGGTSLVTDDTGTMVQLYDYYPYGSELLNKQLSDTEVHHSFTDKELDDNLGLYYFEARWYDSSIGRFSSQDPAQLDGRVFKSLGDPQSLNFYAYSRNNPVVLIDLTGESWYNPASWDVNWKSVSVGTFLVVAGFAEIIGGVNVTVDTAGVGTPLGGLMVSTGFTSVAVGTANIVYGFGGKENEPFSLDFQGGITPTLGPGMWEEVANGINEKLDQRNQNSSGAIQPQSFKSGSTYTVQAGDSLSKIFGSDWQEVAEYNNLSNPNLIQPGQELKVPDTIESITD